jgi:hypothetical protein
MAGVSHHFRVVLVGHDHEEVLHGHILSFCLHGAPQLMSFGLIALTEGNSARLARPAR